VFARRAFERPNVKADGAGRNPREHRPCLARGANWSQDGHDAIAFLVQAGALQNSQSPVVAVMCADGTTVEPPLRSALVSIAHMPKEFVASLVN